VTQLEAQQNKIAKLKENNAAKVQRVQNRL